MVFAIVLWIFPTHYTSGSDMKHIWLENHSLCVMSLLFLLSPVTRGWPPDANQTQPENICCESSFVTTDLTWPAGWRCHGDKREPTQHPTQHRAQ